MSLPNRLLILPSRLLILSDRLLSLPSRLLSLSSRLLSLSKHRPDLERKVVAWVVSREIVDSRCRSLLRLRTVIRLRHRGVVLLSLVGRLLRRCTLSRRCDSPDAHVVVPTSVIFPGPEIESHLYRIPGLILVQIRDLVVAERRQAHVRRIVTVLIFKDKILLCPGAFRSLSALLGKFLFDPAFYFQCHDVREFVKIKPAWRTGREAGLFTLPVGRNYFLSSTTGSTKCFTESS